jgi:hypothetical protein
VATAPDNAVMVNRALKRSIAAGTGAHCQVVLHGKTQVFSVNQFLSKRFKFSENSRGIRFE